MYCHSATSSGGPVDDSHLPAEASSECTSPCRDPESPLSHTDLERFQLRTEELIAGKGCPQAPGVDFDSMASRPALPTPLDQESLLTIYQTLEDRLAELEESLEDLFRSYEQEFLDIRQLLTEVGASITSVNTGSQSSSSASTEIDIENDEVASDLDSLVATEQEVALEALPLEQYVQNWRNGGLIIVENLSDQARTRDIHPLFQSCGTITYLELHGADKSRPHVNTRHAYIHFAEYSQAAAAHRRYHGFHFQSKSLMVFLLSMSTVRGEPGKPYTGPALEILNFAGGSNYASPQADYLQDANADLRQLLDHLNVSAPLQESESGPNTYSLKPNLTTKISALSWRRTSVSNHAKNTDADPPQQSVNHREENFVETNSLLKRQPGAYVPPAVPKHEASTIVGTDDKDSSQPHPVTRILKRGEPLPTEYFKSGVVSHEAFFFERLDVADMVDDGKQKLSRSRRAAVIDDDSDDEEGGVPLFETTVGRRRHANTITKVGNSGFLFATLLCSVAFLGVVDFSA